MKKLVWISKYFIIILSIGFLFIVSGYFLGIRINTTPSIPVGIYKIIDKTPEKGDVILFCPPNNFLFQEARNRMWINKGFCDGELGMMMKILVASEGDKVSINSFGVTINGNYYLHSKRISGLNIPVKSFNNYILKKGEMLTMTDKNPMSFDGRYYGILNYKNINNVVIPIFTW
ncbi:conjugal transfer peptidase TraF [Phocoenobacter uteri]|uniref:Conjugal transfer peptidase TraF n=1 Tax=Phocoenobacter uteri TaxID=146806 RepID=A0A379DET4_9PAST|nr:conjugative transfer signal peptidase TraF [Phocoenobacter uteri]MDG6882828.1 hypothetical protein [Phocoenobacter uteri]SUB76385.1 conjugal transfer peptidase TraF [Phocoenobacter uteri]SUB76427.1 conjugal transfer peptidase TraF [Phocoenobacter uteri]